VERRWYLGVAALLVVVIAVIVFLLLPVQDAEPVPAEAPLEDKPAGR